MNKTGRYARVGAPQRDGDVSVVRALDPVTGLPVRVYRFEADPAPGAAAFRHPNAARVLEAGRDDDGGYAVAEVIDGAADLITRPGALDVATAAAAAAALAAAHDAGLVHGDPTSRRVLRRGGDVWLEGLGVPWRASDPSDDVRRLASSLLEVPGHTLPPDAVDALSAAAADEHASAAALARSLDRLLDPLPTDEPDDGPYDDSYDEPLDEPDAEPLDVPLEEPVEEPVEDQVDEPIEEPVDAATDEPFDEPFDEPTDDATGEADGEADGEPLDESPDEPTDEPKDDATDESIREATVEAIDEAIDEAHVAPHDRALGEPHRQPITGARDEPADEPGEPEDEPEPDVEPDAELPFEPDDADASGSTWDGGETGSVELDPPDAAPPAVVRRRVATHDVAPEPVPPPGATAQGRRDGAARSTPPLPRPEPPRPPVQRSEPPRPHDPLPSVPPQRARPAATASSTPAATPGTFSKTPPPDVTYRVGESPLDERQRTGGRTTEPTAAVRQRRRTWMLAALLLGALVLAIVTAVARRPVPPPAEPLGSVTSIVVDVRIEPSTLPPASLVVLASPPGSRVSAGSALGTVPRRVVFDAEGTWQVEARFQERRSEVVTFRLPDEREVVLRFPAIP